MSTQQNNIITDEEAELYDRQIRLWGAGVQRSLRSTRVLVIGMHGVAAEVCKNLILSGVQSLTMMDSEIVTKKDLSSQYLLYPESIGQNRAEASLKAAQILNPNVKVVALSVQPLDKPISFFSNFDVVCVTGQSTAVTNSINYACKVYNAKFFCGDSFGMFGYLFEDLGSSYKNRSSVSFDSALNFKWTPTTSVKRRKNEDPSFLLFKILTEFRDQIQRKPSRMNDDDKIIQNLKSSILKKYNVDEEILPLEYFENIYEEYGPTCSIIGGMIAQEVIKSLSEDLSLIHNIYFFNHLSCKLTGIVLTEMVSNVNGNEIDDAESIEV